ncbi:MAG: hypothetical protein P4L59_20515 [Desulfosporosinus sp.]|nr:hypothetical protein [Desulfosporosinus sp.]
MKRWTKLIILFLLITNSIFIVTTVMYKNSTPVFKVYSFEGESENIRVSNGVIIISKDKQMVQGGELQYIGIKRENISAYTKNIYIDNQHGNKETIVGGSVFNNIKNGMIFPDELLLNRTIGGVSSEKLFRDEDMSTIKDNLYFSLEGTTNDGKQFNFMVKLQVQELI